MKKLFIFYTFLLSGFSDVALLCAFVSIVYGFFLACGAPVAYIVAGALIIIMRIIGAFRKKAK